MQHSYYWWHALQPSQGDFYADGSHGQRIYVDPATQTVIVQLANQSRQDFPFRKIVAYLNGTTWDYPRLIPGLVRQAAMNFGVDSVRPVLNRLIAQQRQAPERFAITLNGMNTVGTLLAEDEKTRNAAIEVLRATAELYPRAASPLVRLSDVLLRVGDRSGSEAALRRAREIAPRDPEVLARSHP
jgi:hypothetical protein